MQQNAIRVSEAETAVEQRDEPFLVRAEVVVPDGDEGDVEARMGLCDPFIKGQHGGSVPRDAAEQPVMTVTCDGNIPLIQPEAFVLPRDQYYRGTESNPAYDPRERPLHTVTAQNHDGHVVLPYLVPYKSERAGQRPRTHDLEEPFPTVTATGSDPYLTEPYLVVYNGESDATAVDEPLPTVTTRDRFGLVVPELYPWGLDIEYRMLQPRELAAAQGFPEDYDFAGDTKADVTEQIGNAVPVTLASRLVEHLLTSGDPSLSTYGGGITDDPDAGVPDYQEVVSDD
jgi:DNA (cytosine-5)-methyltransferase 1